MRKRSLAEPKHDNKPSAAEIRGRVEFLILEPRLKDFKLSRAQNRETASQTTPTTYDTQEHQPQTASSLTAEDPSKVENIDSTQE